MNSQAPASPPIMPLGPRTPHPVYWVIAVSLAVIAVSLVLRPQEAPFSLENLALAQSGGSAGARGVFAFSGQLTKNTHGVFVVDTDAMTIWTYEYLPTKDCLRLAAARSWRYDRYLENHNICDLPPDVVEGMIEAQRQFRTRASEHELP